MLEEPEANARTMNFIDNPTKRVKELLPYIYEILDALGHPEALITDRSSVNHFFSLVGEGIEVDTEMARLKDILDVPVAFEDYLVDVAERMAAK